jgi:hypothetical protein
MLAHQHNPLDYLRVIIHSDDAQARRPSHRYIGDVGDADRGRFVSGQNDVTNVVERVDETDTADVKGLLADVDIIAAGIDVGILNR